MKFRRNPRRKNPCWQPQKKKLGHFSKCKCFLRSAKTGKELIQKLKISKFEFVNEVKWGVTFTHPKWITGVKQNYTHGIVEYGQ